MKIRSIRSMVESLLQEAEIKINGSNPWDIQVHDTAFYSRVLRSGSLGFGESYMEGLWDTERIDLLIERLLLADLGNKVTPFVRQLSALKSRWVNLQTRQRALEVAKEPAHKSKIPCNINRVRRQKAVEFCNFKAGGRRKTEIST